MVSMSDVVGARGRGLRSTLDHSRLDALREIDAGLAAEVAAVWLRTTPDVLSRLTAAVTSSDPAALATSAHALRGSSANVGADALADACADLELAGREGTSLELAMAAVTREHVLAVEALAAVVRAG